ncbi:MAG: ankyrin repeat domain-containing protein [Rickettsiales bacterium]
MAIGKLFIIHVFIWCLNLSALSAEYVRPAPNIYNRYANAPKPPVKLNPTAVRKKTSAAYSYFVNLVTSKSSNRQSIKYFDYVDPTVKLPNDSTVGFFRKLAALNYLDKTPHQLKAMEKLNKFLATNFKTTYLPGNVYYEKGNNIPMPLHVSELKKQSFDAIIENDSNAVVAMVNNFNILHIKNSEGYSLFSYAVLYHKNDIARMLLYKGAYVNEKNNLGATPLAVAARSNNNNMARELIKNGADPLVKDKFGRTAYDYALMNDNHGLASLIKKYTAIYKHKNPQSKKKYCA